MELFWAFTITILIVLALLLVIRHKALNWAWNLLILAVILFISQFKMTGMPRDALLFATIENVHGEMEVISQSIIPWKFIYLLVRTNATEQPYYIRLPWSKSVAEQLYAASMLAQEQQTALLVDIDRLSRRNPTLNDNDRRTPEGQQGDQGERGERNDQSKPVSGGGDGGEKTFHPRPVQPDPLKPPVHNQIEVR